MVLYNLVEKTSRDKIKANQMELNKQFVHLFK